MYPLALPYGAALGLPVSRSAGFCNREQQVEAALRLLHCELATKDYLHNEQQ